MKKNNIILIGMPGCGKSTVGVVCAKILGYEFLDCDIYIQKKHSKRLWELIETLGCEKFIELEENALCGIECENSIIATGGSAVYGERAMKHLKELGTVVYMSLSLDGVREHIGGTGTSRGVVYRDGADLSTLYSERVPLYEKYADVTVDCNKVTVTGAAQKIASLISE